MKDCGCLEDPMTVDDWCYFHLKIVAGLFGYDRNGHKLTDEQREFIGYSGEQVPSASGLEGLFSWAGAPVEPWERTTPQIAGYGDRR